jgi:hypothetical protein
MKKLFIILACLGAVFMVSNNLLATGGGGGGGGDGTLDKQPQKPFYPDRESQDGTPPPKDEDFSIVKFFTGGHCFIDSTWMILGWKKFLILSGTPRQNNRSYKRSTPKRAHDFLGVSS